MTPSTAIAPGKALGFMTKSPSDVRVSLQLVDQSNQSFQYRTVRPLEGSNPSTWYYAFVDLQKPSNFWGGANNGVIQGQIKSIWVYVESFAGKAVTGSVLVDDLTMLGAVPATPGLIYVNGAANLDNFENRTSVSPWTAWQSTATGMSASVSPVAGYGSTRALALNYSLTCTTIGNNCGQYLAATLALPYPITPGAAIGFMTKSPAGVRLSLRIIDSGGQTLQYRAVRPLEGQNPTYWYPVTIDLRKAQGFWGGANNGVIQGQIKSLWILAETTEGKAVTGAVTVDDIVMLAAMPTPTALSYVNGVATIDDFENRNTASPWTAWQSAAAGTSIGVSTTLGYASTRALALNYSFTCATFGSNCGQYGAATFPLPIPVTPGAGMSFMTKSPPEARISLHIVDQSGQTLKYRTTRPLEGFNPDFWYKSAVDFYRPMGFWGGANNGAIQGQIKAIWVIVESSIGKAVSGTVSVDDLSMLSIAPAAPSVSYGNGTAVLDNFDSRTSVAPWTYQGGDALSHGSIQSTTGATGSSAIALTYNFTCQNGNCGKYVLAGMQLPFSLGSGAGIALKAQTPADASLRLRVVDSGGQTLQYRITRPLESADPAGWYDAFVSLAKPMSFWGGAANGMIQFPIVSLSIVANNLAGMADTGQIRVDDIVAVANLDAQFTLNPSSSPVIAAPASIQNLPARIGIAHAPESNPAPLDQAKAAGAKLIRTDLILEDVENSSGYNFQKYDEIVAALDARGMGALFIVRQYYTSPRYSLATNAGITSFGYFAEAAARRYAGRNVRYEVWNEPDEIGFWGGRTPSALEYAAVSSATIAAIRRGDPAAKVSTAGISMFMYKYISDALNAGAASSADAIGLHGYREAREPESVSETLPLSRKIINAALGDNRPVWMTEWGYSNPEIQGDAHTPQFRYRQANLLSRKILSQCALDTPMAVWYNLVDSGTDPYHRENNFGLLDVNNQPKTALQALKTITSAATGRLYRGLLSNTPPGLHVMKLEDATKIVFIAWNSDPGRNVTLNLPIAALDATTDFLGASIAGNSSALAPDYRIHTLTETSGPVFITYTKSP
ncbi:MAG: cellulase family glycosylhydrolase [Sterolibacteriaceae bacterium]|nr:cellulase family glycosylhydrolase [Sterolibacteriaceae bacterium]MBK9084259.1 cellulase family glycosylhydrolase [Sterolibacteriaceae bacterium]